MEEQLNAGIHTKSGKSLMNAFLRARTAFGFEYLISLVVIYYTLGHRARRVVNITTPPKLVTKIGNENW